MGEYVQVAVLNQEIFYPLKAGTLEAKTAIPLFGSFDKPPSVLIGQVCNEGGFTSFFNSCSTQLNDLSQRRFRDS